jgi:hypothetical protein
MSNPTEIRQALFVIFGIVIIALILSYQETPSTQIQAQPQSLQAIKIYQWQVYS